MLQNILITSIRNFIRNKSFTLINLVGLSISMSLAMLIIMIIRDQYSFDKFHSDSDRIYRVNNVVLHPEWGNIDLASAPLPLGQLLKDDYSFGEQSVRINRELVGEATFQAVKLPVKGLLVDPSFLEVFNFPFEKGNPATALVSPRSVVLTKQTAAKIFGTADPIGQTISLGRYGDLTVTGVLQQFQGKTHLEFEMLGSLSTLTALESYKAVSPTLNNWNAYFNNYVYIKLKDGHTAAEVEQALSEISKKYSVGMKDEGRDISYSFYLDPLDQITPGRELSGRMGKGMPAFFLVFLGVLAGVVLLMSVFNFTSLTIAKSLSRAREIGIRKVVGANRRQVFAQFIGEAIVFSLGALAISYLLLQFLKVAFFQLSLSQDFFIDLNENVSLLIIFVLFAIGVGLLAGILPATYLSAFKPSAVLKDIQNLRIYSRLTFRKILMTVQFTLSVVFVIVVLVVYRQIDFMLTADYGIDQRNNLNIELQAVPYAGLANEIRSLAGVVRVGGVSHRLGTFENGSHDYRRTPDEKPFIMSDFLVDDNYIANLAPTFLAGRNFDAADQSEREKEIILNESAVSGFGFNRAGDAIGETVYVDDSLALRVIGVVKDFNFRPLNNKIGPLALRYNLGGVNYLSAKIDPAQKEATIQSIQAIWKKYDPNHPMEFAMMEDEIDEAYNESGLSDALVIVGYITFLVISLACLGMLGMAMYATRIREKEVGIRKVMGASVADVVLVLSKSYLLLIGIAILVGVPVSVLIGEVFLQDFAYKAAISPLMVGFGIVMIAGLGLLTIGSQTVIAALSNPVKGLRNE